MGDVDVEKRDATAGFPPVEVSVRSPTQGAWTLAAAAAVAAGEILHEVQKTEMATFFGRPFADDELWGAAALALGALAAAIAWLVSLYARPGRLRFDLDRGILRRELRPFALRRVFESPLDDWRIRLVYFSEPDHAAGRFKRLELESSGGAEVLLFSDLRQGERMARAFEAHEDELGELEVVVEKKASVVSTAPR